MDEVIERAFRELRAHERASAPDFEELMARLPPRRRRGWMLGGGVVMAAAIAAIVLWPRPMEEDVAPLSITQWHAPTDVLLDTPGTELLRDVPKLEQSILNLEAL